MNFRLRAFSIHLLISFSLLTLILVALYVGWYHWPGWYLLEAETVVGLLVLVDIGLGPLATLLVSNPSKPRTEWRRDIAFIATVQLLALGYGAHTLWVGRPVFYALSLDRVEVVRALTFKDETVQAARLQGATILPEWSALPRWIWAPLPDDAEKREEIINSAMSGGDDVVVMPQYFRPWADGKAAMDRMLIRVDLLANLKTWVESDYQTQFRALNRPEADVGALPVRGTRRDGAWIIDRATGEPLAFWPVEIWSLKKSLLPH